MSILHRRRVACQDHQAETELEPEAETDLELEAEADLEADGNHGAMPAPGLVDRIFRGA